AHVATVVPRFAQGPAGLGHWVANRDQLVELNTAQIAAVDNRTLVERTEQIRCEVRAVCAQVRGYRARMPSFRFHGGSTVRADLALGILLGELVIHGRDLARTIGKRWPIDPHQVALIMKGVSAM